MKRRLLALALAISSMALAACGADLITGGPLLRPGEPTGIIRVQNASGMSVTAVLISTCSASTYGMNRMAQGEAIAPGRARDFVVSAGCWDVDAGVHGYGDARQRLQVQAGSVTSYTVR